MCHSGSVGFLAKRASLYRGWPATQVVKRVVNPVVKRVVNPVVNSVVHQVVIQFVTPPYQGNR